VAWPPRLEQWREPIEAAAAAYSLAPELIAAVMDRESEGGLALSPPGPAGTGDGGNGLGLMQLDRRYHTLTEAQWQDPYTNISLGAEELRDNLDGLDQNLLAAICAYNASIKRVRILMSVVDEPTAVQFDALTTGKDYVSWVLARMDSLQTTLEETS
jgi:soluble lytic murein transglycosylase-like protein